MGSGGSGGFGGGSSAPATSYSSASAYSRDYGNPAYYGPADGNTQTRQFANVGKANINLLDPLAAERANAPIPIDPAPDKGPLGGLASYYSPSTPGGFFAGILGAVASTAGGLVSPDLAKVGSDVGQFVGKTMEAPLAAVGGVGLQSIPFLAPVIDSANSAIEQNSPYILRDTLKIPTNLGGAFQSLLNIPGLAGRAIERTYAGMADPAGKGGLLSRGAIPADIQARVDSGELSHDQALDELVMSGRGFTDDPIHNMVFSILTDPFNWASLGVGTVAGAVKGTASVARVFSAAALKEGSVVAELANEAGYMGDLARAAQAGEDLTALNLSRSELSGMRRAVNEDLANRVQNGEDISNHLKLRMVERLGMSALGPISEEATNNLVYRVAEKIAKVSDPINYFSGSKAGQRSMEILHQSLSTGVIAALKPEVVRDITKIADDLTPEGGDLIMDAVGTWGGNAGQEVVAGEMAAHAMQTGAIPKHGTLNATEASRQVMAGGGYDSNIGKYAEAHIERTKDIRVASLPVEEMRSQTVAKLAAILGVDARQVDARVGKVSADMAMAVHGLYYYAKGKVLHTSVMQAIRDAHAKGLLNKEIDPHDLTMITPRTLTNKRVAELDAAIKAGDGARVRAITENYDDFNWMNRQTVKDAEVVSVVKDYLDTARSTLPQELEIFDPVTGLVKPGVPKELEDWARDGSHNEYGLANGMPSDAPMEAQWRVTHRADGGIRNARPWLQFWADGIPSAQRISRWESMQMSMFRGIRGERIWWNQRRRFITDMASTDHGNVAMPPALSDRIFKALMYEAQQGRLLPRGMAPEQMMDAAAAVIRDARGNSGSWQNVGGKLTERQVVTSFLRAMEGDVSLVGVTQKITGRIKSSAPGAAANYWGQLSEKLYPLMRFTLNPVFMTMEVAEPYILNFMRGVPLPLRRDSEKYQRGLATHNAIRQFIFASREEDGLLAESSEMNALRIYQAAEAKQRFGPSTLWSRIRGTKPAIAERKQAAAGLEARRLIGDNLYAAFQEIKRGPDGDLKPFNDFWGGLEYEYGTVDRAEVAERWLASNLSLMDKDGHRIGLVADLMNAKNIGAGRLRLTTSVTPKPGDYTFGDVEELLDSVAIQKGLPTRADRGLEPGAALMEDLRSMTEDEFMSEVERAGMAQRVGKISDSAANDIWRLANGPNVDDFWKGHRDTYLRDVRGPAAAATRKLRDAEIKAARAIVQGWAAGKNLTEEEYIALHFDDIPRWAADAGVIPAGALTDIRGNIGEAIYEKGVTRAFDVSQIRYLDRNAPELLNDPSHAIAPTVAALREGSADRGYLYVPMSRATLDSLKYALQGYGSDIVAGKYDDATTDPIRLITRKTNTPHIVRIKRSAANDYMAYRSNASNLKRPVSHDFTVADDIRLGEANMEVYTPDGWVDLGDVVAAQGPVPSPSLREGYSEEPWLDHLFGTPPSTDAAGGATSPWGLDFKAMLTPAERAATKDYEGVIYANINTYLRGVPLDPDAVQMSDDRVEELIAHLDASIKKGVLRERKPLYRGVNITRAKEEFGADLESTYDLKVGDTLNDPAFLSTSDEYDQAETFSMGGGHKYEREPGHIGVVIEYDLPPGFHMNLIEGGEGEHLLGRDIPFRVVRRTDKPGLDGTNTILLTVKPIGEANQRGVNRLILGDPANRQRNFAMARHLAATDPEGLRRLARDMPMPDNVREGVTQFVEQNIAEAEAARPAGYSHNGVALRVGQAGRTGRKFGAITPEEGLAEIEQQIDENDLPTYVNAWDDTRSRIESLSATSDTADEMGARWDPEEVFGSQDTRMLAAIGSSISEKGGRGAVTQLLSTMERLWNVGPRGVIREAGERGTRDSELALLQAQHMLRGIRSPFHTPNLPAHINDAMDVLLGNENRRHIGRQDLSGPIVADDAAYEAAGYLTQETADALTAAGESTTGLTVVGRTEENHAYLIDHYNKMAALANEKGLGGFKTWTPADMALMAGKAREELGRAPTGLPSDAIEANTRTIAAEVYFPKGSPGERLNPLLDLLNRPENRAARHEFMRGVGVNLMQELRDEFGIIVDGLDDRGIGIWDANVPQPLVPLTMLSTGLRGNDLADIMSYVMQQAEVWHYTVHDFEEVAGNFEDYHPRVTIVFDPTKTAFTDAEKFATGMGEQLPFARGATAVELPDHSWQLSIIDTERKMPRLDSGAVDEEAVQRIIEEAGKSLDGDVAVEHWIDYGKTYVAGPDRFDDGTYDWGGHLSATTNKLAARGTSADGAVLDRLRAAHLTRVQDGLEVAAPDNFERVTRGDAPTDILEDKRGGQVFGTTTPVGANAAVIRGFGATDPVAGLHELIHVFSIAGADPSLRDVISKEWEQHVTAVETAATNWEARAAAATNNSTRSYFLNKANAARAGIQTPSPGAWGKAQEEFFVHQVLDWINRGVAPNPEMANAFEHFRNWLQLTQKQRTVAGMPPIEASPQMQAKLTRMFSRPGVETVPYSIEQETMRQAGRQVVRSSWEEAHATQYYKRDRSMVERSLNHPYIGLYPVSYMWGKILPEMVRFLALRPFGMETPFLAWNVAREVSDTIRTQSQTDPSWKKFLDDNKDAFMMLSMLFPALPQDIPANASLPLRRVAEQGLEQEAAYARGQKPKGIDYTKGAMDAVQYAVGPLGTIRTVSEIAGMGGDFVHSVLGGSNQSQQVPVDNVLPVR